VKFLNTQEQGRPKERRAAPDQGKTASDEDAA